MSTIISGFNIASLAGVFRGARISSFPTREEIRFLSCLIGYPDNVSLRVFGRTNFGFINGGRSGFSYVKMNSVLQ